jgi:hypothetical protein
MSEIFPLTLIYIYICQTYFFSLILSGQLYILALIFYKETHEL